MQYQLPTGGLILCLDLQQPRMVPLTPLEASGRASTMYMYHVPCTTMYSKLHNQFKILIWINVSVNFFLWWNIDNFHRNRNQRLCSTQNHNPSHHSFKKVNESYISPKDFASNHFQTSEILVSSYDRTRCDHLRREIIYNITINVPLILKMREIIFFCGQITLWAISMNILRVPRLFLT